MARPIAERKTKLEAVVPSLYHGLLVLRVAEEGIWYRQKGRRKMFLLPHGLAYQKAVALHVQRERGERKASRKRRR